MSVKFYYGRRIDHRVDKVHALLMEVRPSLIELAHKEMLSAIRTVVGESTKNSPFAVYLRLIDAVQEAKRRNLDCALDFELTLALYPLGNSTLAHYTNGNRTVHGWFDDLPFVKEYGYWNNTDRPDEISSREWARRRRAWDKAWPEYGRADHRRLTLKLLDMYDIPHPTTKDFPDWTPGEKGTDDE